MSLQRSNLIGLNQKNQKKLISMNKKDNFQRLRLLDKAQIQLENLRSLKNQLSYQPKSQEKDRQCLKLKQRASNLIELYQNFLCLYFRPKLDQKDKENDNVSFRRSHSRSKLTTKQTKIEKDEINSKVFNSTISCTIAYLQTNFLGSFQQAGTILIKSKDDLGQFIQRIESERQSISKISERKSQLSSYELLKEKKSFERDEQQSDRSSISLSKFYNKQSKNINTFQKQEIIFQHYHQLNLVYIRICMNLVINLIVQNRHTFAVEVFKQMVEFVQKKIIDQTDKAKALQFIYKVWFNIDSGEFITWKDKLYSFRKNKEILIQDKLSVQESVSLSHFIFNSDLFSLNEDYIQQEYPLHYIKILQKAKQTFIQNSLYQMAFFTLRHLFQSPVSPQLKQNYYIQLREMLQSGRLQQNIQLQNIESVQCFRTIITTLNHLSQKYQQKNKSSNESIIQSKINFFKLIVKIQSSKISSHSQLPQNQKDFLIQKLSLIKNQTKIEIIDSMLSQKLTKNIIKDINQKTNKIITFSNHHLINHFNTFITCLKSFKYQKTLSLPLAEKSLNYQNLAENRSQSKLKIISPTHSRKYLKVISSSILTDTSIHPSASQKHKIFQSNVNPCSNDHKKLSKMVRFCEYGGFLNKRNFNSDGGEFKYIKITKDKIKWSKNAQKIDESSQSYPLKDIRGIIYGKITPNLKKSCNKGLKQELCFSLILQKRTMDFCCKDYKQVESWVCGISTILKKQINGYTPGKMRWRKMFIVLRQAFIDPLKLHQRNQYYFENAYSLKLFKQNGYKLPHSQKIL